jgi:phenylacetate-CoA ligase
MTMKNALNSVVSLFSIRGHSQAACNVIQDYQNTRLRRLVVHAYNRVPYYRTLFDRSKIKPETIRTSADLSMVPITSKKDLRALPTEDLLASGVDRQRLIEHTTSGSTGEPFTIRRTWLEERLLNVLRRRAMHYFGLRMDDRQVTIGLTGAHHPRNNQLLLTLLRNLRLYRSTKVDCRQPLEDIVRALRNLRIDVLGGYPGVLARIATILNQDGGSGAIHPRFVAVGGEVLSPRMRDQMSRAFAAPVFDMYGSHEFNLLAWQCKQSGEYHVCSDGLILEVLKEGRSAAPGEWGEVVGTNLHSFAMPFIRYRLGDVVQNGSLTCRCGQPYPTLRQIRGRMIDYFQLDDGRMIHPYDLVVRVLDKAPWIGQYQLVQEKESLIALRAVASRQPTDSEVLLLQHSMKAALGTSTEFRLLLVPEIAIEPSGKYRVSRSLVNSLYDETTSMPGK